MLELLKMLNFVAPNIEPYEKDSLKVTQEGHNYQLFVNGQKWNNYNAITHSEIFQVFSHYYLSYGHCICTGLGFLMRESWILNNLKVSRLTVLEKSKDLIEYQQRINPDIMSKIEVINCDANEFIGKCDVLLLDHYEQENDTIFFESLHKINKNIKSDVLWPWSVEPILDVHLDYSNASHSYIEFKKRNDLHFLPNLTEQEILMFISMFFIAETIQNKKERLIYA